MTFQFFFHGWKKLTKMSWFLVLKNDHNAKTQMSLICNPIEKMSLKYRWIVFTKIMLKLKKVTKMSWIGNWSDLKICTRNVILKAYFEKNSIGRYSIHHYLNKNFAWFKIKTDIIWTRKRWQIIFKLQINLNIE